MTKQKYIRITPEPVAETTIRLTGWSVNAETGGASIHFRDADERQGSENHVTLSDIEAAPGKTQAEKVLHALAKKRGGVIEDVPEAEPEAQPAAANK